MTWGQLRFQLQTSAPGVSLDLIDEWLNTRYEQVLEATDWQGLNYHTTVQTQAAYQSGTGIATTTATGGSASLTITVASATGLAIGQTVAGAGIAGGTTVANLAGLVVTLSAVTTAALNATQLTFTSSDSVTVQMGNSTVTGADTWWTSAIVGQKFYVPGDVGIYTVTAVGSNTSLTLDRPYEGNGVDLPGTTYAGSNYVLMQNVYPLPSDVRAISTVLDPVTGFPLNPMSKDQLDQSAGPRTLVNDPTCFAPIEDSNEAFPPVIKQIEFFPPPLHNRGMVIEYLHVATAFDGGNTSGTPLPFVSNTVLLAGVRADIAAHLGNAAQALIYGKAFDRELDRLLLVEHAQRRVKVRVQMADRFTRHRLQRASRGFNNAWGPGAGGPN